MAKSNFDKLQEAIAAGDLEAAKALTAKIKAAEEKKKAVKKPAAKRSSKKTPSESSRKDRAPSLQESVREGLGEDIPFLDLNRVDADWMAPSQKTGSEATVDDKGRRRGRRESMQGMAHTNTFVDNGKGGLDSKLKQVEKQLAKQASKIGSRPAAKKVRVRCDGCDKDCVVYDSPGVIQVAHDDNGRPYRFYKCDRCVLRRR